MIIHERTMTAEFETKPDEFLAEDGTLFQGKAGRELVRLWVEAEALRARAEAAEARLAALERVREAAQRIDDMDSWGDLDDPEFADARRKSLTDLRVALSAAAKET